MHKDFKRLIKKLQKNKQELTDHSVGENEYVGSEASMECTRFKNTRIERLQQEKART